MQDWLHGKHLYSLWALHSEGPMLDLILCYCRIEMLKNFLTGGPAFSFCTEPHKLCSWSCFEDSLPQGEFLSSPVYTLRMGAITEWF